MSTLEHPTSYPAVNAVLQAFLMQVQAILGDHFRGMYLSGSLALGDFSPHRSDIDFVVVTDEDPDGEVLSALQSMHVRFNASDSPWATEVEAAYIPQNALRRYDPADARHPHIERGATETLDVQQFDSDWIIQRFILREHGVAVAGPDPRTLIDPVLPQDLRLAVITLMNNWWGPMRDEASRLEMHAIGYQAYAVLTMCRILYTLEMGVIVSKPVAANWAQEVLGGRWAGLIERALAWRKDYHAAPLDGEIQETQALIAYTMTRCSQMRLS